MSHVTGEPPVDPALDALLLRTLGAGALPRERRRQQLAELGLPVPPAERGVTMTALPLPAGSPRTITFSTDDGSSRARRKWLERAAVVALCLAVAGALALLLREDDDEEPLLAATPVSRATFALVTSPTAEDHEATPPPSLSPPPFPPPTATAAPSPTADADACDTTPWLSGVRGLGGMTTAEWLDGDGLSLGRIASPLVEGPNPVFWVSAADIAALPGPARVALTGTRFGPTGLGVPLEQRYGAGEWTLQTFGEGARYGIRAGIVFPAAGCWQIEAEVGTTWLRAIVEVEAVAGWQSTEAFWDTLGWRPVLEMGLADTPACLRTPPRQVVDDFGPLAGDASGQTTPVYLSGLDETGALHIPAVPDGASGYVARVGIVAGHDYPEPLLIRTIPDSDPMRYALPYAGGESRDALRLSGGGDTASRLGWRHWSVELHLAGPGCYAMQVDGVDFTTQIVFEAVQDPPLGPPAEPSGVIFALLYGESTEVAAIDAATGGILHRLEVTTAGNGPLLAVSPDGERVALPAYPPGGTSGIEVVVYRTSDWSEERRLAVPKLIQYIGSGAGIWFSDDGRRLYAYQYDVPSGQTGENATYWIGVYDIETGAWLHNLSVPGCEGIQTVVSRGQDRLFVLCSRIIEVIDPLTGAEVRGVGYGQQVAAFVISGETLYAVSPRRAIFIQGIDAEESAAERLTDVELARGGGSVPFMPIAIDAAGRYLSVPVATVEDAGGSVYLWKASQIAVIDLAERRVARTMRTSAPFSEIAFSPDGATAYIALLGPEDTVTGLARIDLATGVETPLLAGNLRAFVAR